jgi:hypothetical protein
VEFKASAIPVAAQYYQGDRIINTAPAAGGTIGWVCTAAGTPGTWETFGTIVGITALANDATPTVAGGSTFITGGDGTITDFDDGTVGQTITVLSEHDVTITDGTHIILHGSADLVMAASDSLTLVLKADNKWYETSRMVNAQTVFTGSASWTPGTLAAYDTHTVPTPVPCAGAVEGMFVSCSHSDMTDPAEFTLHISGYVATGGGAVVVSISNLLNTTRTVGAGTVKVRASAI